MGDWSYIRYTVMAVLSFVFLSFVLVSTHAAQAGIFGGSSTSSYMKAALRDVGKNPTGWSRKWCAKWMSDVLARNGKAHYGNKAYNPRYGRATKCKYGAIAVMSSHTGLVTACHADGSATIVSGNHSGKSGRRTVGMGRYRASRIRMYRMP